MADIKTKRKKIQTKQPITIGRDSVSSLIEIDIFHSGNNYEVEPLLSTLQDQNDKGLQNIQKSLKELLVVENLGKEIAISIRSKNNNGEIIKRPLGKIVKGKYIETGLPLTTLEIKMLSLGENNDNYNRVFANRNISTMGNVIDRGQEQSIDAYTPHTDLHTHLTGQLTSKQIYDSALKVCPQKILFNIDSLKRDGILPKDFNSESETMNLAQLDKVSGFREKMLRSLEVNPYKQITFTDMDAIYKNRNPFFNVDDIKLTREYIMSIASSYAKSGVKYAELSVAACFFYGNNQAETAKKRENIEKILKETKTKYGVDISFLVSHSRGRNDEEGIKRTTQSLTELFNYPFISGVDLLGHETTRNKEYNYLFASAARVCALNGLKKFTLRSHAGESEEHEGNIKEFLLSIKRELDFLKKQNTIPKDFQPDIRIGHGLHGGLDKETLSLIKEMGVIIEINASSNLSLNNISELNQIPIKKYLDAGVRVVLGTDGGGMYLSDARQEALIAMQIGVTPEQLKEMTTFEDKYIEEKIQERNSKRANSNDTYDYVPFTASTKSLEATRRKLDYSLSKEEVKKELRENNPLFICGCEEKYENVEYQKQLAQDIIKLVRDLKTKKGESASVCIYDNGAYINTLVSLVCKKEGVKVINAKLVDSSGKSNSQDKYQMAGLLANYYRGKDGQIAILGGGMFASDLLVKCNNAHCRCIIDSNLPGTSKQQADLRDKMVDKILQDQIEEVTKDKGKRRAA